MQTEELLAERATTHGNFVNTALTIQRMNDLLHTAPNWDEMPAYQKEALEMVVHKIGRILHGDPNFIDTYRDIIGYTKRVIDQLEHTEGATDVANSKLKFVNGMWEEQ